MRSFNDYLRCASVILLGLSLNATLSGASFGDILDIKGKCWTRSTFRPVKNSPISTATYCFRDGGEIDGFWFDAGDAGNLSAFWKMQRHRIIIRRLAFHVRRRDDVCDASLDTVEQVLRLRRCDLRGDWNYDARMTEAVFRGKRA